MDDIEIIEIFWDAFEASPDGEHIILESRRWQQVYEHGMVDHRRIPLERWKDLLKKFPLKDGVRQLHVESLPKVQRHLYAGDIKKPFDPQRLKEGVRPSKWIQEMYQKVLKFETTLKIQDWNKLIATEINARFKKGANYHFNNDFKEYVQALLEKHASSLRKLEVWVFTGPPEEISPSSSGPKLKGEAPSTSQAIQDSFTNAAPKNQGIQSIEKRYYMGSSDLKTDDEEALNFLDEMESWDDDNETDLP